MRTNAKTKESDLPTSLGLLDDLFRAGFMCASSVGSRLQRLLVSRVFNMTMGITD